MVVHAYRLQGLRCQLQEIADTTKKSSCPGVFFPAFLQTAVIDKPVAALFENAGIYVWENKALSGLFFFITQFSSLITHYSLPITYHSSL